MGDVCKFRNGFSFKSGSFGDSGIPVVRIGDIVDGQIKADSLTNVSVEDYSDDFSSYYIEKGDIVIAMSGATTGKIGINNTGLRLLQNQRVGKFLPVNSRLNNKYLYYFLQTKTSFIYQLASGGAQPNLSSKKILSMLIPIPPLSEQQRIVDILDKFDALVNDISQGLPAEIEARRKQYEYYRDKLLTFKKKED